MWLYVRSISLNSLSILGCSIRLLKSVWCMWCSSIIRSLWSRIITLKCRIFIILSTSGCVPGINPRSRSNNTFSRCSLYCLSLNTLLQNESMNSRFQLFLHFMQCGSWKEDNIYFWQHELQHVKSQKEHSTILRFVLLNFSQHTSHMFVNIKGLYFFKLQITDWLSHHFGQQYF